MRFLLSMLVIAAATSAGAGAAAPVPLRIIVRGVPNTAGVVRIAVYRQANFLKGPVPASMAWLLRAQPRPLEHIFRGIPGGSYAVVAFHDANNNGKLDRSPVGIPLEKVAFSNNAVGVGGPPTFGQAGFNLGPRPHSVTLTFD